jgi:hypothetical protein
LDFFADPAEHLVVADAHKPFNLSGRPAFCIHRERQLLGLCLNQPQLLIVQGLAALHAHPPLASMATQANLLRALRVAVGASHTKASNRKSHECSACALPMPHSQSLKNGCIFRFYLDILLFFYEQSNK